MSGITAASMAAYAAMAAAAVSAYGAIQNGKAQAATAQSQADAADYNAKVGQQNAEATLRAGSANEEAQRRKSAVEMGRLHAGMAENGIGLDSGTATDLTVQSSMNAEMDALNIRYGAAQNAQALQSGAVLDLASARNSRKQAKSAMTSGYLNAGASALSAYGTYTKGGK